MLRILENERRGACAKEHRTPCRADGGRQWSEIQATHVSACETMSSKAPARARRLVNGAIVAGIQHGEQSSLRGGTMYLPNQAAKKSQAKREARGSG